MHIYESVWLKTYFAAREIIAKVSPTKLDEFEQAVAVLRTDLSCEPRHIRNLLDANTLDGVRRTVAGIDKAQLELHELKQFGRFVVKDLPAFTRLHHDLTDQVTEWAGEALEPSYNFLSLYTRRGVCEPHLDAPSAKWTLDICIDQSAPWPIHFGRTMPWSDAPPPMGPDWQEQIKRNPKLEFRSVVTEPGDGVLFSGSSQWHYRDPMPPHPQAFCDLLFLHYIPKGTSELIQPANWSTLFDVPELGTLPDIDRRL